MSRDPAAFAASPRRSRRGLVGCGIRSALQNLGLWTGLLALTQIISCSPGPPEPPNILLVMVDTLRADRLGAYGNRRDLTPSLDRFARHSHVFHNAIAQSSWTSPSVASLLTSRFQSQHGVLGFDSVLGRGEITLPEVLRERGYLTAGFCANSLISRKQGFAQGFDFYRVHGLRLKKPRHILVRWIKGRADEINRSALSWLDGLPRQGRAIFLYLHYMEPHTPFAPTETALARIFADRRPPDFDRVTDAHLFGRRREVGGEMLRDIRDAYDAEVMSLDLEIGTLFSELERRGFLNNALVVFTSDHGEEFKDHGFTGHGHSLYDELIRIPLLIRVPHQSDRVDVEEVVSLIDVAPTLAGWVGNQVPPSFEGRSLRPILAARGDRWPLPRAWHRRSLDPRPAFSELIDPPSPSRVTSHERAVMLGSRKLITGTGAGPEFYGLTEDPEEKVPTGLGDSDRRLLQETLAVFVGQIAQRDAHRLVKPLDSETREQIRALGYVE